MPNMIMNALRAASVFASLLGFPGALWEVSRVHAADARELSDDGRILYWCFAESVKGLNIIMYTRSMKQLRTV